MTSLPTIYVWNQSPLVSDAEAHAATAAIQRQVTFDFAKHWSSAVLHFVKHTDAPPKGAWVIRLVDNVDEPGALGYHMDASVPSGVVGVKTCLDEGITWSSCLSHEVLEMIADPECCRCFQVGDKIVSLEVCDAVEGRGYKINGVEVSNFNTPAYFCGGSGPYDKLDVLTGPFPALDVGGYSSSAPAGEWSQALADKVRASKRSVGMGSRRAKRAGAA